jgi:hypothetical protein
VRARNGELKGKKCQNQKFTPLLGVLSYVEIKGTGIGILGHHGVFVCFT